MATAPAPPTLLIGTIGTGAKLCLSTRPEIRRAYLSAPPPCPAIIINSTGFVGSQAFTLLEVSKRTKLTPNSNETKNLLVSMAHLLWDQRVSNRDAAGIPFGKTCTYSARMC